MGVAEPPPPTRVDLPEDLTDGALKMMRYALDVWFDCFEEMQADFKGSVAEALRCEDSGATTAGADAAVPPSSSGGAGTAGASPTTTNGVSKKGAESSYKTSKFASSSFSTKYGWWMEEVRFNGDRDSCRKASVMCGAAANSAPFVSFCEEGVEVFGERDDPELSGVFVKVAGRQSARRFTVPSSDELEKAGGDDEVTELLEMALLPLGLWADSVPPGSGVFLAMVNMPLAAITQALAILAPLGISQDLPPPTVSSRGVKALAAVGMAPKAAAEERTTQANGGNKSGGWWGSVRNDQSRSSGHTHTPPGARGFWPTLHASSDIAYSSVMLRQYE